MYYFCQYNDLFTVPTNKNKLKYFCRILGDWLWNDAGGLSILKQFSNWKNIIKLLSLFLGFIFVDFQC